MATLAFALQKGQPEVTMPNDLSQLRVLIVDDEPLICWSIAETLGGCGAVVTQAATGLAAVRALAAVPEPDVVLLDYHLPDSHDLRLLATMKRMSPRSQVILMSACCTPEIARRALAVGACLVVGKPLDMCVVPALVREVAGLRPH
jgi:CheY-like chemotaxis protein